MSKFTGITVRYIGKSYASWFGGQDYIATPRHVRCKGNEHVDWRITDRDGDPLAALHAARAREALYK